VLEYRHKSLLQVLNLLIPAYPEGMDQTTNSGETPLDILGHTGYVEKRDKHGMPPLHHVCKNGYSEHLIRFLIQAHPASITIQDSDGRTPFHYYTSIQGRELCNEVIALLQPLNKRRKFQVAAPTPALPTKS